MQITEYFAFLPREAVTKFLTQCEGCLSSSKFGNSKKIINYEEINLGKCYEDRELTTEPNGEEFSKIGGKTDVEPNEDKKNQKKEQNYADDSTVR